MQAKPWISYSTSHIPGNWYPWALPADQWHHSPTASVMPLFIYGSTDKANPGLLPSDTIWHYSIVHAPGFGTFWKRWAWHLQEISEFESEANNNAALCGKCGGNSRPAVTRDGTHWHTWKGNSRRASVVPTPRCTNRISRSYPGLPTLRTHDWFHPKTWSTLAVTPFLYQSCMTHTFRITLS